MGDAAHAISPTFGQGACLAIESAAALVHALQRAPSIETALRQYERVRQRRTARIIDPAWRFGSAIQWQNPLACALRGGVIRCTPSVLHECWLSRIVEP